eukprot:CAMPEP_0202906032 /NCGR_PEP_ID=MMETSP1392-20130828/37083_1 /ASSEMBLY_ACC=CAM_ASM_000868 /TAXON_ID=225041 /ORGANISM="Chlamydomonas chlamydogama, Strain SAG 11-48b" /LENGTH=286 /DNA_ID=CAMNT_0049594377 /DNA_START=65 /DNA_END=921 /DNA_ORIENTATION=-
MGVQPSYARLRGIKHFQALALPLIAAVIAGCIFDVSASFCHPRTYNRTGTIPTLCTAGNDSVAGTCYPACGPRYIPTPGNPLQCIEDCKKIPPPNEFFDDGNGRCIGWSCRPNYEISNGTCYPLCRDGFQGALSICYKECGVGQINNGTRCILSNGSSVLKETYSRGSGIPRITTTISKKIYNRTAGFPPSICGGGMQKLNGLCYVPCAQNWDDIGTTCYQVCPPQYPVVCAGGRYCGQPGDTCSFDAPPAGLGTCPLPRPPSPPPRPPLPPSPSPPPRPPSPPPP